MVEFYFTSIQNNNVEFLCLDDKINPNNYIVYFINEGKVETVTYSKSQVEMHLRNGEWKKINKILN